MRVAGRIRGVDTPDELSDRPGIPLVRPPLRWRLKRCRGPVRGQWRDNSSPLVGLARYRDVAQLTRVSDASGPFAAELYLLIHSFLANGPFSRAADALREDLEEQQRDALSAGSVPALAPRFDWLGAPHVKALVCPRAILRRFGVSNRASAAQDQAGPASPDLLPKLLCRLSELSEQYIPGPAPGIRTFIGTTDASSLLRTRSIAKERRFAHSEFNLSGVFRSQLANAPKLGPLAGVVDIGAGRGMQNIGG